MTDIAAAAAETVAESRKLAAKKLTAASSAVSKRTLDDGVSNRDSMLT